jgi:ribosomal protein S18 acetylase RimI-like enzyme
LLVGSKWTNAIKIYNKYGLELIEKFDDYFGGNRVSAYDGYIMYKRFID